MANRCGTYLVYPGGACNEPTGRGGAINIPNQGWQKWRVIFDRTSSDWRSEHITWYMNGQQFHQVRGDQINDAGVWASLAQKPLFFILNVAVGGDWVGLVFEECIRESSANGQTARVPQRKHGRRLRLDDGGGICRSLFHMIMATGAAFLRSQGHSLDLRVHTYLTSFRLLSSLYILFISAHHSLWAEDIMIPIF